MTDDELYAAIQANPAAKACADVGNDSGAALAVAADLPPVVVPRTYLTDRSVIAAFANPVDGETALQGFAAAAQANPLFSRVLGWLKPSEGGLDFGNPSTRAMLDLLQSQGALTADAVSTLKAQAERPTVVAVDDVSRVMLRDRPDGRVVS